MYVTLTKSFSNFTFHHAHGSTSPCVKEKRDEYLILGYHHLPTSTINIKRLSDAATADSGSRCPVIIKVNLAELGSICGRYINTLSSLTCWSSGHHRVHQTIRLHQNVDAYQIDSFAPKTIEYCIPLFHVRDFIAKRINLTKFLTVKYSELVDYLGLCVPMGLVGDFNLCEDNWGKLKEYLR